MPNKLTCAANNLILHNSVWQMLLITTIQCVNILDKQDELYGNALTNTDVTQRTNSLTNLRDVAEHFSRPDRTLSDITVIPLEAIRQRRETSQGSRAGATSYHSR